MNKEKSQLYALQTLRQAQAKAIDVLWVLSNNKEVVEKFNECCEMQLDLLMFADESSRLEQMVQNPLLREDNL